jgi:hypothetical protein
MPRTVISARDISQEPLSFARGVPSGETEELLSMASTISMPVTGADDYKDRLLKYIPAEVIALYMFLEGIIKSAGDPSPVIHWAIFFVGVVGTYLYLLRIMKVGKQLQLVISVVAFCVWVLALGGPFVQLGWYKPVYGTLILPIYTFFVPMIEA